MQLLVVDTSRPELDALAAEVRTSRPAWSMVATTNLREAETRLGSGNVDAIAVAVGRIGGAGERLLPLARSACPAAVRIGLMDAVGPRGQALDSVHQLLPRPLRGDLFVRAVESATALGYRLRDPLLKRVLGAIERLPAAPSLYLALNRELARDDVDAQRIADLVRGEPAIAAKVLQLCNSAMFSRGSAVADIGAAVMRLGLDSIYAIVLAAETFGGGGARHEALQQRALVASQLAMRMLGDPVKAQFASTAAVLADVGALLPLEALRQAERSVDEEPHDIPLESLAGAYLLGLWGLPGPIVEAVAYRHRPDLAADDAFGITGAVHVASAPAHGEAIDEDYLEAVEMAGRLAVWQQRLERMMEAA